MKEIPGGTLLIVGSILSVVVMAFHPTGHDLTEDFRRQAQLNVLVHSAAMAALPMILLGLLAARRRLGSPDSATAALVAYGMGALAWMCAAVASGFVQTELFSRMIDAEGDQLALLSNLSSYTHFFNQGFAKVGVVASAVSIGLLSVAIWQSRKMPRLLAVVGGVLGTSILLALFSGHVTLGVHGFGLIVLAQAAWFVALGIMLIRD